MAGNKPENDEDWLGANMKVFPPDNHNETVPWSWPPSKEVMNVANEFLTAPIPNLKTCFSFHDIPCISPESKVDKHSIAAHCLIYAPTHDLWKGCAMVNLLVLSNL